MFTISTAITYFKDKGNGCYTKENIKKGQIVWQFDSRYDLLIPLKTFLNENNLRREFLFTYGYLCLIKEKLNIIVCGDNARFMNHDYNPTVITDPDDEFQCIASRDVNNNEELTCNYNEFDLWNPQVRGF